MIIHYIKCAPCVNKNALYFIVVNYDEGDQLVTIRCYDAVEVNKCENYRLVLSIYIIKLPFLAQF